MSKHDFQDFLNNDDKKTPAALSQSILQQISYDMNPDIKLVTLKFTAVQFFSAMITLFICPQFEVSFTSNTDVFHFFHRHFGMYGCMLFCGFLFIGTGTIVSSLTLRLSELKKIHKYNISYFTIIALLSLIILNMIGQGSFHVGYALTWFAGAVVSSIAFFEAIRFVRVKGIKFA